MSKFEKNRRLAYRNVLSIYPDTLRVIKNQLYCVVCKQNLKSKREVFNLTVENHLHTKRHAKNLRKFNTSKWTSNHLPVKDQRRPSVTHNKSVKMSVDNDDVFLEHNQFHPQVTWSISTINPATPVFMSNDPHPWSDRVVPNRPQEPIVYPSEYQNYIHKMRNLAYGKYIWFCIDESRDEKQRIVISFIFGILNAQQRQERYLFSAEILTRVEPELIAELFELNIEKLGRITTNVYVA